MRELTAGATATLVHPVRDDDSATRWENDLPVLATPVLLWLGEVAAMHVLADRLEPGEMSVGVAHDSGHLAPTPVGQSVTITATFKERRGAKLVFDVEGHDHEELVYRGTHTRAVVQRAGFLAVIDEKARRS